MSLHDWKVHFFDVNGVLYHLALFNPEVGYSDLSLLGARIIQRDDPYFPRGNVCTYSVQVPNPEKMIAFLNEPNLIMMAIIDQERSYTGWHLLPDSPDFVLTLRKIRSKDPAEMNCVEWIVFALELGGVDIPDDVLTTRAFRSWLRKSSRESRYS